MEWYKNKKLWSFAGGIATALIGAKIVKAPKTRQACVKGIAAGMTFKKNAEASIQNLKEDAQDICNDAREEAAKAEDKECEGAEA